MGPEAWKGVLDSIQDGSNPNVSQRLPCLWKYLALLCLKRQAFFCWKLFPGEPHLRTCFARGCSLFSRLAITTHCLQIKSFRGSGTWYNPEVNICYRPKRFFFLMQDFVYIGKTQAICIGINIKGVRPRRVAIYR